MSRRPFRFAGGREGVRTIEHPDRIETTWPAAGIQQTGRPGEKPLYRKDICAGVTCGPAEGSRRTSPCIGVSGGWGAAYALAMAEPTPIEVTAAVIERSGRYLIARRPDGVHLARLWEFPGGKCEDGESLEHCLARELREELGVTVEVGPLWRRAVHRYPEKAVALNFFLCGLREGEPRPMHGSEIAWASPEEFARYQFPEADESVLAAIRDERPSLGAR